jgi:response regulator RpfG family c-di-GMP phosphodiesterase
VADLCVGLAESVSLSNLTRLRNSRFTDTEVRELRYAALLHDFGKVGVRESVLVKEKKLTAGSLENIQYRILLAKERLKTQSLSKQIAMLRSGGLDESRFTELDRQLAVDTNLLDEFYRSIVEANEPSMLKEDNREMLERINAYRMESQDADLSIITPEELDLLSIAKGSLSPAERKEIESHVVHTQNFLNHIPWTKEFSNVPTIAAAHHEKLDGTGYPYGMIESEIPLPSKIMTICDIYDALTASDRPYKPAMKAETAIDVLVEESKRGLIDSDLVKVFIDAKVFHVIDSKEYSTSHEFSSFSHHPCDVDLHDGSHGRHD